MIANTIPAAEVLPVGAVINYTRTAPMTYQITEETAVVEGRIWYFDDCTGYFVRGGECVYPHQLRD